MNFTPEQRLSILEDRMATHSLQMEAEIERIVANGVREFMASFPRCPCRNSQELRIEPVKCDGDMA